MIDGFVLRYDDMELGREWYYFFYGDHDWELRRKEVCFVLDYLFEDKQETFKDLSLSEYGEV